MSGLSERFHRHTFQSIRHPQQQQTRRLMLNYKRLAFHGLGEVNLSGRQRPALITFTWEK
ncbi:hypothetical protein [Larkinella sp.]|uniref:hypothetical protein n=1 Tax=Larkinella sp. TaxID=2034517 RepID=UPI003BA87CC6